MLAIPAKSNWFRRRARPEMKPFVGLPAQPPGQKKRPLRGRPYHLRWCQDSAHAPSHDRIGQMAPTARDRMSLRSRPVQVGVLGALGARLVARRVRESVRGFGFCCHGLLLERQLPLAFAVGFWLSCWAGLPA
jgi:hypothetical protein